MTDTKALFQPVRFAHANLYVGDVERSVDFYRDVCGITEVFREPGIKAGFLSNGATHHDIGLMQVSDKPLIGKDGSVQNSMERGRRPGLNHLAFHVASEASLVEAHKRAADIGVAVEKALDHGMSRSLYLFDPDNNAVEFYIDTVADWRRFYDENRDQLISMQWDPANEAPTPAFDPLPRENSQVEAAPFHAREICGATLVVADLARSLAFYRDVAGLILSEESPTVALLALPGKAEPCLALVVAGEDEPKGLHSLWFLADDQSPELVANKGGRAVRRDPDGLAVSFHAGIDALPKRPAREDAMVPTAA